MHTCPVCATKCVLLLFLSLCRCSLAQLLIDSTDMGVHKCEFQGRLGDETVQLYVFLTACVRPFSDGGAPPGAMKSTIKTTTTTATKAADGNAPAVSPSVQGAPAGAHGTRVLAAAEAAPPSPPLQPPPLPNFFLSGFAFMFVPKQPVHTTQLQQPLSTILWAAQRPRGDYHLPQPPVGRAGASSSSSSNNNVGSSSSSSSNASGSTNAAPNGNRSSSSSSSSSSSTGGSSSGGGDVGAGGVTSSRSDATNNDIPRVAGVRRPRGLMQEDVTAPWPPDTYLGAVYEAAVQLVNGTYGAISIRSLHSSQQHAVHLSFRDPLHWIVNPHLRRVPGRLSLRAVLSPDDLAAITNVTTGTATESAAVQPGSPAFEIRATGFDGTCSYTPSPSRGRTLLPAANIPTCGWLDPDRVAYDNSIYKIWRSIQQQNGPSRLHRTRRKHQRRKQKRRQSPPPPPPPPPATSFSPPKYMVLSPYFNLAPYDFATLLIHHLDYHATLGIQHYLVYIEEGQERLMQDTRLTALAAAGRLQLVCWRELPTIKLPGTGKRHPYGSQILIYNHALLSLWHEPAVVAVADLDEYLVTKHPMTLDQVLLSCSPQGRYPAAALWIPRRSAICTTCWLALVANQQYTPVVHKPTSRTNQLQAKAFQEISRRFIHNGTLVAAVATLERRLWLTAATTNASAVQPSHPLEHYRHWLEGWHYKSIMYSHRVSYVSVHSSYSLPSGRWPHTGARAGCAVWLHVETQLGPRDGLAEVPGQVWGIGARVGEGGKEEKEKEGEEEEEEEEEEEGIGANTAAAAVGNRETGDDVDAAGDGEDVEDEGAGVESEMEGDRGGELEGEGEKGERGKNGSVKGTVGRNGSSWGPTGRAGGGLMPLEHRYYWALDQRMGRATQRSVSSKHPDKAVVALEGTGSGKKRI